jgi:hypothetical protein
VVLRVAGVGPAGAFASGHRRHDDGFEELVIQVVGSGTALSGTVFAFLRLAPAVGAGSEGVGQRLVTVSQLLEFDPQAPECPSMRPTASPARAVIPLAFVWGVLGRFGRRVLGEKAQELASTVVERVTEQRLDELRIQMGHGSDLLS